MKTKVNTQTKFYDRSPLMTEEPPLSSAHFKISAVQENMLNEMLMKVQRMKREMKGLKDRVSHESNILAEKKVTEAKSLKREFEARMGEFEQNLNDNMQQISKRYSKLDDIEYEIKYKQARSCMLNQQQIERLDQEIKMFERPLALDCFELSDLKVRLRLDLGPACKLDDELFNEKTYTFDDQHHEGNKRKGLSRNISARQLDLAAENSKLESIIEQYRETNEKMKKQLLEIQGNGSKAEEMMAAIKNFFDDLKTAYQQVPAATQRPASNGKSDSLRLVEKLRGALESREENYFKECLKDFTLLLAESNLKIAGLEEKLLRFQEEQQLMVKNYETMEYEMKDVMRTARLICDPSIDQPVNLYQLKMDLKNKLKSIDDHNEVAYCLMHQIFMSEHVKTTPFESTDDKENVNPNKQYSNLSKTAGQFKTADTEDRSSAKASRLMQHQSSEPKLHLASHRSAFGHHQQPKFLQMRSLGTQIDFKDEEVFPHFDYRKCTRCGKNDTISPNHCFYSTLCTQTDSNNMSSFKFMDRIAACHAYQNDKSRTGTSFEIDKGELTCIKKQPYGASAVSKSISVQTVLGLEEIKRMKGSELEVYKHLDKILLSPK